jgi:hypothetical protein
MTASQARGKGWGHEIRRIRDYLRSTQRNLIPGAWVGPCSCPCLDVTTDKQRLEHWLGWQNSFHEPFYGL